MATIQRRFGTVAPATPPVEQIRNTSRGITSGLASFGAALEQRGAREESEALKADKFDAQIKLTNFGADLESDLNSSRDGIEGDGRGFAVGRLQDFDTRSQEILQAIPESQRQAAQLHLARVRSSLQSKAEGIERTNILSFQNDAIADAGGRFQRLAADGGDEKELISSFSATVDESNLDANAKRDLKRKYSRLIAGEAERRKIRTNPERRQEWLSKPIPATSGSAMEFFTSKGWTREQAAGIIGNLIAESNLNTTVKGDAGTAQGIAQWRGNRLANLKKFARDIGGDWKDFATQLAFVDHELRNSESTAGEALRNAKTVSEATQAFIGYERPRGWTRNNPTAGHNYRGRLRFAQNLLNGKGYKGEEGPDVSSHLSAEDMGRLRRFAEAQERDTARETEAARKQAIDNLQFRINDGTADENDIAAARGEGLFRSFEEFRSVSNQYKKRKEEAGDERKLEDFLAGNLTVDLSDPQDRKMVENATNRIVSREAILNADEEAATKLLQVSRLANGTPKRYARALSSMIASDDNGKALYALQTLNRIRQVNPDAFARDFNSTTEKAVSKFAAQAEFTTPEKILERIRTSDDPVSAEIRKQRLREADKQTRDLEISDVTDKFDTAFSFEPSPRNQERGDVLLTEYKTLFREEFATSGNAEEAEKIALDQLNRVWGVSSVTGENILMKHAPEKFYPSVGGSKDWMAEQLESELKARFNISDAVAAIADETEANAPTSPGTLPEFQLVPVAQFNAKSPKWNVAVNNNGVFDLIRDDQNRPLAYAFDAKPFIEKERREFDARRERILEDRANFPFGAVTP